MEDQTNEHKPAKPFASLAQARRCDSMVTEGVVTKEVFERDLLATDLEAIPWRKGPLKPEDPDQAGQDEFRAALIARKAALESEMRAQTQIEGNETVDIDGRND